MMKKMKDRLHNKKGFTLVELIVVIVIILILAAVLIPNVMRYIGQAKESSFQSEASAYLTELQGYSAEYYARHDTDLDDTNFPSSGYVLTDFATTDSISFIATLVNAPLTSTSGAKTITVEVDEGAVLSFSYANETYVVQWTQAGGWTEVSDTTITP